MGSKDLYKQSKGPDGRVVVNLYRERKSWNPLKDGVDVSVLVSDSHGHQLFNEVIAECDRWGDVEILYGEILFDHGLIKICPEYWNGSEFDYYIIDGLIPR